MSLFERYLTLWVALCIVAGIALGYVMPGFFHAVGEAEVAKVNLPVAVLIWLMVIPMLLKIDFASLRHVGRHWRGIGVTLFINWAVKPFSMAALGWLFIGYLFRSYLPAEQIDSYIAGLIILAAAPCTAMVFVWSNLTRGEPHFTLSQVALNDSIMVVAFAPIVGLLLGLSAITVPWGTLVLSVVLYIVIPVIIAQVVRGSLLASGGQAALDRLLAKLGPVSLVALLADLTGWLWTGLIENVSLIFSRTPAPVHKGQRTRRAAASSGSHIGGKALHVQHQAGFPFCDNCDRLLLDDFCPPICAPDGRGDRDDRRGVRRVGGSGARRPPSRGAGCRGTASGPDACCGTGSCVGQTYSQTCCQSVRHPVGCTPCHINQRPRRCGAGPGQQHGRL
ncbi:Bile acid:sodium symporter [Methylorubrum extorquens DSM 13060]|uniref:Bile acid:sodium symporter n=1 Tax=Methylorubrum extorquens DSM 13060 TaxID=882800 RepID=H1KJ84_METEX|nr:Bile acid:sodium symporter [Methylorubrum extorquens DSM 13060]